MPDTSKPEIKLFYCYAREDKALRDKLEIHLSSLKRRYHLTNWSDREILPGEQWEQAIHTHLDAADVILLLISPHFLASDYCYGKEMQRALERHAEGSCLVIPILLRPAHWEGEPFGKLRLLPTDAKPITRWHNRDEAFHEVTKGIGIAIQALLNIRKIKEQYEKALAACNQALRLDPNNTDAYRTKGIILGLLKQHEEALTAFDQTLRLDSNDADAYCGKGAVLICLERYEEALTAFDQTTRLDPNNVDAYVNKGITLNSLERYEEALTACDQAIRLDPNLVDAYRNKGNALQALGRREEAQQAFDKARQLGYNG